MVVCSSLVRAFSLPLRGAWGGVSRRGVTNLHPKQARVSVSRGAAPIPGRCGGRSAQPLGPALLRRNRNARDVGLWAQGLEVF